MKVGIVKLSTLVKHNRWDPRFYLGDPAKPAEIADAESRLKQAQALVDKRKADLAAEQDRITKMEQDGEIEKCG